MIKIGMRPRRLGSSRALGIILDQLHPFYENIGENTWAAACPACGGPMLVIVGDVEDRPDDVYLWCRRSCTEEESFAPIRRALQAEAMRDPPIVRNVPEVTEDAVRYPTPPSNLSEGERNRGMFAYACALRRIGLNADGIESYLQDANNACSPPLDNRALRTIARSAEKYPVDLNVRRTAEPSLRQRLRMKLGMTPRMYDPKA